jgi:hypothetical protein
MLPRADLTLSPRFPRTQNLELDPLQDMPVFDLCAVNGSVRITFIVLRSNTMQTLVDNTATNAEGHSLYSIHSAGNTKAYDVPRNVIQRPLMSEIDENKVESLMKSIQVRRKAELKLSDFGSRNVDL